MFFCGRSEFFKVFIQDHFLEAHEQINDVQVFTLQDISIEAFIGLISFIYQNQVEVRTIIGIIFVKINNVYLVDRRHCMRTFVCIRYFPFAWFKKIIC